MPFDQGPAFQDHCQQWHRSMTNDHFDGTVFVSPPPPQLDNQEYRQWQNFHHRQLPLVPTASFGYGAQPQRPQRVQSASWFNDYNSRQRLEINAKSQSANVPPRKTLLDTFVDRNDEYWKSRVTLKIDVSFTDHSHIIGKNGQNTQSVMKDTTCHIHFPDANRNPEMEKSNMVTISGPMQKIDKARRSIRDLAPLVITMELKNSRQDAVILSEDPLVREIVASGVNLLVRSNRCSGTPYFILRGSVYQTMEVRQVMLRLQQRFLQTTTAVCSTSLDVLKNQQIMLLGSDASNVRFIAQRTGATIHYPRGESEAATTFFIQGTIDSVLSARHHLIGCLPLAFIFEVEKDQLGATIINDLQQELGLSINLRPSRCGNNLVVIVKGPERMATSVYSTRQRVVGGDLEPPVIVSDYDFMKDFAVPSAIPSLDTPLSAGSAPTVFAFPNPFAEFDEELDGPELRKPKRYIFAQTGKALEANSNKECMKVVPFSPFIASPFPYFTGAGDHCFYNYQWDLNGNVALLDREMPGRPSSQHQPANPAVCEAASHPSSANSEMPSATAIHFDPVPEEAPLASGILKGAQQIQENACKWRAPGAERDGATDYDKQQLLATKAMRQEAEGQRIPTDCWSGLGFSRSMPPASTAQLEAKMSEQQVGGHRYLEDDNGENKIGPWTIPTPNKPKKAFHSTAYDYGAISTGKLDLTRVDDVATILSHLHLIKYVDIFREQEIDIPTLMTMNDTDLKELGVNTFGARRKLLVVISELKETRRRDQ